MLGGQNRRRKMSYTVLAVTGVKKLKKTKVKGMVCYKILMNPKTDGKSSIWILAQVYLQEEKRILMLC